MDMEFLIKRIDKVESDALTALTQISTHEQVCSERYESLNKNQIGVQTQLTSIHGAIDRLLAGANESRGMWKAIGIISVIIGILYTILQITGRV